LFGETSSERRLKMVSKVSEITIEDVANYIRIDDYEESDIETYLKIAKSYISNYTGIPEEGEGETLDTFADFVIVVYVLCQDMYDNRTMYVNGGNINKVVQTILDMHTRNNL
jgi:hypothetical protein